MATRKGADSQPSKAAEHQQGTRPRAGFVVSAKPGSECTFFRRISIAAHARWSCHRKFTLKWRPWAPIEDSDALGPLSKAKDRQPAIFCARVSGIELQGGHPSWQASLRSQVQSLNQRADDRRVPPASPFPDRTEPEVPANKRQSCRRRGRAGGRPWG